MKQPINKTVILNLYTESLSYAKVGAILGISRQRVHQVVTGYTTIDRRGKLATKLKKNICERCSVRKSVALHHKDYDSSNNIKENLINLCSKCHTLVHKRRPVKVVRICEECKREYTFKRRSSNSLLSAYVCTPCKNYEKNYRGSIRRNRNIFYPKNCVDCGIETQIGKRSHNRCVRCNEKFMYRTQRKEYHKAYYEKIKNNPVEKEKRRVWNKAYYLKNAEYLKAYYKDYKAKKSQSLDKSR